MRRVLMFIGYGWAILGVLNLIGVYTTDDPSVGPGIELFAVLINIVLFILPGLAVGGIGQGMMRKSKAGS